MKRRKLKGRSTVLVFHSSVGNSWHETLSGISRYAAEADWRVQTFDHVRKLPARALKVNHDNTVFGRFAAIELISAEVAAFAYYGYSGLYWSERREEDFRRALKLNGRPCATFMRRFAIPRNRRPRGVFTPPSGGGFSAYRSPAGFSPRTTCSRRRLSTSAPS